jgi:hypothetical protein
VRHRERTSQVAAASLKLEGPIECPKKSIDREERIVRDCASAVNGINQIASEFGHKEISMRFNFTLGLLALGLSLAVLVPTGAEGDSPNRGLTQEAEDELRDAGVDKYLGAFTPAGSEDVGDGWVKHSFDPDGGNGPICIAGTPYSVFTREGNPAKLLILLQGGGACWQGFTRCNFLSEDQEPPVGRVGIWDFDSKDNPFRNYSIVYMPYCDGSVFGGDNTVDNDESFPGGVRHHRGLRNLSAGMDVGKAAFPNASTITVAGSSAGGVGAAAFAPFLARFQYGNNTHLTVFNDAGPIAINLAAQDAVAARGNDWQFAQFYPASCTECSASGQQTAIVDWRLENDRTIREAFYETDADGTNIGFASANLPGFPPVVPFDPANMIFGLSQVEYRGLILTQHGALNAAYPDRYKTFIVSGDSSHTALQSPRFYSQDADGVLLNEWTDDFVKKRPFWSDIVEDFIPLP